MKRILLSGALAVLAGAALAQSGDDAPPSVEARHGLMENFSFSLATLGTMAKGEMPYDAELAQTAADRLVVLSTVPQTGYWVEGTSSEERDESRALPVIWKDMEGFLAGFDDLHEAASSMAEVAGDGREAVARNMRALGEACGGCHEDYRMSDD